MSRSISFYGSLSSKNVTGDLACGGRHVLMWQKAKVKEVINTESKAYISIPSSGGTQLGKGGGRVNSAICCLADTGHCT